MSKSLKGISVSPGVVFGKVFFFSHKLDVSQYKIDNIESEWSRFEKAIKKAKKNINKSYIPLRTKIGDESARILSVSIAILDDPMFHSRVHERLLLERYNIEYIVFEVLEEFKDLFVKMEQQSVRDKVSDISDVQNQLLAVLSHSKVNRFSSLRRASIVAAKNLTPSDIVKLSVTRIKGIVLEHEGATSHVAILAHSLGIPTIVGVEDVEKYIEDGQEGFLDADEGRLVYNFSNQEKLGFKELIREQQRQLKNLKRYCSIEPVTKDGKFIQINANISFPDEVNNIGKYCIDSVGLFRTEFLCMNRDSLPDEEEQFLAYKKVAEYVSEKNGAAVIRTLDVGGDKVIKYLDFPEENNPELGLRAIRISLAKPEIFKVQLRAILRASAFGKIKIMFPMISMIEEIISVKKILVSVKKELASENIAFDKKIEVGVMIEVPSAIFMADILAKEVDFFSIGTNDLTQFLFAGDRTNDAINYLLNSFQLPLIRVLKNIIDSAHKYNITVGVCGEMCNKIYGAFLLLGLGVDSMSMSAICSPNIKKMISMIDFSYAKKIVEQILKLKTKKEIILTLKRSLAKAIPVELL